MTVILLILLLLALPLPICHAQNSPDGVRSPEELHAYIVGLSSRSFDDLVIQQVKVFQLRYPKHPLSREIAELGILSLSRQKRPQEVAAAIATYLTEWPQSPRREDYLQYAGESYLAVKRYADAKQCFEELLKSKSGRRREEAQSQLALCLLELGNSYAAVKYLEELSKKELKADRPARILAREYLAHQKVKSGEYASALKDYQELLKTDFLPHENRGSVLLAAAQLAYQHLRDYKEAADLYGKFIAEYPSDKQLVVIRRCLLECQFQLKQYSTFLRLAQEYFRIHPTEAQSDVALIWLTAQACRMSNLEAQAVTWLNRLLQKKELSAQLQQRATSQLIECLVTLQRMDQVITNGKKYLQDYPNAVDKARIARLVGFAAESSQQDDLAKEFYQKSYTWSAEDAEFHQAVGINLVNVLLRLKKWSAASLLTEELANTAPDLEKAPMLYRAAAYAAQAPDHKRSLQLCQALLKRWPGNGETQRSAMLLLLQSAKALKLYPLAESTVESFLKFADAQWQWHHELAILRLIQQNYQGATTAFHDCLQTMPATENQNRGAILATYVQLLLFLKHNDEALKYAPQLLQYNSGKVLDDTVLSNLSTLASDSKDFALAAKIAAKRLENPALTAETSEAVLFFQADMKNRCGDVKAAAELLQQIANLRRSTNRPPMPAASALAAELALKTKEYSTALIHAENALRSPEAIPPQELLRAQLVKAQLLYERDKDLDGAFRFATLVFIRSPETNDYVINALRLAITISYEQNKTKQAKELEAELKDRLQKK